MKSEIICIIYFSFILSLLTYVLVFFERLKYSYRLSIGFINIIALSVFCYITNYTEFNNYLISSIVILSFMFHFEKTLNRIPISRTFSITIMWLINILSYLLCFSGIGAIMLLYTLPISYLFGFYLLNSKQNNIYISLVINTFIAWGLLFMFILWEIKHL